MTNQTGIPLVDPLVRYLNQRRLSRLIEDAKTLTESLTSVSEAEKAAQQVDLIDSRQGGNSWDERRALTDSKAQADKQWLLLKVCLRDLEKIRKLNSDSDNCADFIRCFGGVLGKKPGELKTLTLDGVEEGLEKLQTSWNRVRAVPAVKTRVLAIQSVVRFSELNRLAVASIVSGLLVSLGAVWMAFFYQAAAHQSLSRYWTLDDLVVNGIMVVPRALLVLFLCEVIVRSLRTKLIPVILRHPTGTVFCLVAIVAVSISVLGHWEGRSVADGFEGDEVATMTAGNAVLNKVTLVGTTARTAVFLQETNREAARNEENKGGEGVRKDDNNDRSWVARLVAIASPYVKTALCVADEFRMPLVECERSAENSGRRVVVMDRAHVVCHAKLGENGEKNACEDLQTEADAVVRQSELDERIADQTGKTDNGLRVIEERVTKSIVEETGRVQEHMDRHYRLIMERLVPIVSSSDDVNGPPE